MARSYYKLSWSGNATKLAIQSLGQSFGGGYTAVGDFNADGYLDLLASYVHGEAVDQVITTAPPGRQVLLLGRGDGKFTDATATLPNGGHLNALIRKFAVGDFNGDGFDDMAMSLNWETGRSAVDPNTNAAPQRVFLSQGGQLVEIDLDFNTWAHAFAAGDLNMDGRQDFIIGGFTVQDGPGTGTAAYLQNPDGSLTRKWMDGVSGGSIAVADFDLDGRAEIVNDYGVWGANGLEAVGMRIFELDTNGNIESFSDHPDDDFVRIQDGMAWNGPTQYIIREDIDGNEYIDGGFQEIKTVDINRDGRPDIVGYRATSSLAYNENNVLVNGVNQARLMMYTMDASGTLVPLAARFAGWEDAEYGMGDFRFLDWNGDGHLDIFIAWENDRPAGPRVYLNDGNLNFARLKQSLLPDPDGLLPWTSTPIDVNGDGIMDIYMHPGGFDATWSQWDADSDQIFLGTRKFYTGPKYTDPALKGAAGFNEQYYLNTYADAKAAVAGPRFATGLEHYLEVGKKEGYFGFAVDTHIFGSDKNDTIKAREGEERLDGGLGKDKLTGKAGADEFVFSTRLGPTNVDTITDFKPGQGDTIGLDGDIFRKIGAALTEKEFYAASGATKAHDRSDRIVYDTKSGKLFYDADGSKKGDAIHFATLSNKAALDVGDFAIV